MERVDKQRRENILAPAGSHTEKRDGEWDEGKAGMAREKMLGGEKKESRALRRRAEKTCQRKIVQRRENGFPLGMRGMKTKEKVANGQRGGQNNKWNGLKGR